jgi:hypothetical protein
MSSIANLLNSALVAVPQLIRAAAAGAH